jgi:ABC-type branched-subunit amino acid transport system substrate-binding protein
VTLFKKVHQKYLAKTVFDGNTEYGMAQAYTFVQVLQRAGKNPTRESLLKALESGALTGPTTTPFGYGADSHGGVTGVQIVRIVKGVPVTDGPPSVTDGATGPITPYTGTPAEAPANGIPQAAG